MQTMKELLDSLKKKPSRDAYDEEDDGDVMLKSLIPSEITYPNWPVVDKETLRNITKTDIDGKYLNVRIFSSDDSFKNFQNLAYYLNKFIVVSGLAVKAVENPRKGSWYQNIVVKFLKFINKEESQKRIRKMEKARDSSRP